LPLRSTANQSRDKAAMCRATGMPLVKKRFTDLHILGFLQNFLRALISPTGP
jgi:hypothetical protein